MKASFHALTTLVLSIISSIFVRKYALIEAKISATKKLYQPENDIGHTIFLSNKDNIPNYSYATFMASITYLPALEVFLYTFSNTQSKYPITICIPVINNHTMIIENVVHALKKYNNIDWNIVLWKTTSIPGN